MRLRDSVWIHYPPERVYAFFEHMDEHYLAWHPDHRLFRWEQGRGLREGVRFYFEEVIGRKLMKKQVEFTRLESPNQPCGEVANLAVEIGIAIDACAPIVGPLPFGQYISVLVMR